MANQTALQIARETALKYRDRKIKKDKAETDYWEVEAEADRLELKAAKQRVLTLARCIGIKVGRPIPVGSGRTIEVLTVPWVHVGRDEFGQASLSKLTHRKLWAWLLTQGLTPKLEPNRSEPRAYASWRLEAAFSL